MKNVTVILRLTAAQAERLYWWTYAESQVPYASDDHHKLCKKINKALPRPRKSGADQ